MPSRPFLYDSVFTAGHGHYSHRIEFDGESAREAERFELGRRIRAVEQGPDGAIWLLEDGRPGRGGQE